MVRYIGFSVGSALAASILAGATPSGSHLPTVSGYHALTWIGVGICVIAAAFAWIIPAVDRRSGELSPEERRREEEESELASRGPPRRRTPTSDPALMRRWSDGRNVP